MKIIKMVEDINDKGDSRITVELTTDELQFFVEYAINNILEKEIKIRKGIIK